MSSGMTANPVNGYLLRRLQNYNQPESVVVLFIGMELVRLIMASEIVFPVKNILKSSGQAAFISMGGFEMIAQVCLVRSRVL